MLDRWFFAGLLAISLTSAMTGCADDAETDQADPRRALATVPCLDISGLADKPSGHHLSPARTEQILALFAKHDLTGIVAEDLAKARATDGSADPSQLPKKPVLLYFSTLRSSFYDDGLPLLEQRGIKSSLAIKTKSIGKKGSMTVEELQDVLARGVTLATEGRSGEKLTSMKDAALKDEIEGAQQDLDKLGLSADSFLYPDGRFDARVKDAVKAAGFEVGLWSRSMSRGGYAGLHASQRFALGCATPATATTVEAVEAYLTSSRIEVENIYDVTVDTGFLDKVDRGNADKDSFGHIYMADEGDTVSIQIYFAAAGSYTMRARVKSGTQEKPTAAHDGYRYKLDKEKLDYEPEPQTEPESKHIVWGTHLVPQFEVAAAGWHTLEIECLRDWACLIDWLEIEPR